MESSLSNKVPRFFTSEDSRIVELPMEMLFVLTTNYLRAIIICSISIYIADLF